MSQTLLLCFTLTRKYRVTVDESDPNAMAYAIEAAVMQSGLNRTQDLDPESVRFTIERD